MRQHEIDPANPTVVSICSGPIEPNTGIKKFVDSLPDLGPWSGQQSRELHPDCHADTITYPGSDYYEIELIEYTQTDALQSAPDQAARLHTNQQRHQTPSGNSTP